MKVQNLDLGLKVLILLEGPHGSMKDHIGTMVMFYIRSQICSFSHVVYHIAVVVYDVKDTLFSTHILPKIFLN